MADYGVKYRGYELDRIIKATQELRAQREELEAALTALNSSTNPKVTNSNRLPSWIPLKLIRSLRTDPDSERRLEQFWALFEISIPYSLMHLLVQENHSLLLEQQLDTPELVSLQRISDFKPSMSESEFRLSLGVRIGSAPKTPPSMPMQVGVPNPEDCTELVSLTKEELAVITTRRKSA